MLVGRQNKRARPQQRMRVRTADDVARSINRNRVARNKYRREERQTLNMIPVRMADEQIDVQRHSGEQRLRQRENASTGIQDNQCVIVGSDFDAGRVATVLAGSFSWRRN